MRLIVSEKPSVAYAIAAALKIEKKQKGFLEGNGCLVSWCFGHLAALAEPEQYDPQYKNWRIGDLPIVPSQFRYCVFQDKQAQFDLLKALMHRQDVSEVINACDAGREGELIFRTVYELAGCTKPMKRLWISSMEDEAIRKGFQNLRPGSDFDGLYQSALCRAKADWLVGINATRFFSLLYGTKLNVGRVMSPTLAMMVQREAQISAFVPERFYTVNLDCGFTASSDRIRDFSQASKIADVCKGSEASLQAVEQRERTESPPLLYDLTTLQRDANRLLGYTAQQTLDYLQSLYEKKLCTYPRTDSRYLTDDMLPNVDRLGNIATSILDGQPQNMVNARRVCNSQRVTDHHAIVPTPSAGAVNLSALPVPEQKILKLVCRNLLEATSPAHRWEEVVMKLSCAGAQFTAKEKRVLELGWKAYENLEESQTALPDLQEGQALRVSSVTVKEGQTAPPKHYTEDTLLSSMEAAGDISQEAGRKGLGTPATRAGIIEKLVSAGMLERRKVKKQTILIPASLGNGLITVLPEQLQSPHLTAVWEQELLAIQEGRQSPDVFLEEICAMLRELFAQYRPAAGAEVLFPSGRERLGKCPRCGKPVVERGKGFFCTGQECHFALWKNNRFFAAKRKELTAQVASALLEQGQVLLTGCYSEKTGKCYDARAVMEDDGSKTTFRLVFAHE